MLRRILGIVLAGSLLLCCLLPAAATEEGTGEPVVATEVTLPPETTAETTLPAETEETEETLPQWPDTLYFGLLHAHTDISDGLGTVEEAFAHAAAVEGLDFFAVTDHSNSFDNDIQGGIALDGAAISDEWAAGKAAAAAVTDGSFVGIFGYEMTWQEGKHLGHISTFNTPGWESRNHSAYESQPTALETYYKALVSVPGSVSQFNHPGDFYGDFENFGHYSAAYDEQIHLLEVGGEGDFTGYDAYTRALDAGWHLAPSTSQNNHKGLWGDADEKRTVILAKELTEQSLYEAIRSYRVYATEDRDLEIRYALDGAVMGSAVTGNGDYLAEIWLRDPTDAVPGKVEVIAEGGKTVAAREAAENGQLLYLTVPGGSAYYYLRITQEDGDIAVTAPVWVEQYEDLGISRFEAGEALPVAGKALELTARLYNAEDRDLVLHSADLLVDGETVYSDSDPGTVRPGETLTLTLPYTHPAAGLAEITLQVTGTVAGDTRVWEAALSLYVRAAETVSGLLIDGSHGNMALEQLSNLKALAASANMDVTVFSGEMPRGGQLLLVTAPAQVLEDRFLAWVEEFLREGGSLIVTGGAGGSPQLNRLLKAAGSTMKLNADLATDDVNNGGTPDALFPSQWNSASSWCDGITGGQFYSHHGGCTLDPGSGTWLVKNREDVLLACEETPWGGWIFAAGCPFVTDPEMPEPQNRWDPPGINQTILETILGAERTVLPPSDIQTARHGEEGDLFRITGYVTAGTSNKYTTFPETVYLQDDTGGIAVTDFTDSGIRLGAPVELMGTLHWNGAVPELRLLEYRILEADYHNYDPRVQGNSTAMDYDAHGGELRKIQGKVTDLEKTGDGSGLLRLVLTDSRGAEAIVEIESSIRSGSTGKNTLAKTIKKGSIVRAMGLLHINAEGETVLRVRNCDEVVYVPSETDPTNPDTGHWLTRIWKALPFG